MPYVTVSSVGANIADLIIRALVRVHLSFYVLLHGYVLRVGSVLQLQKKLVHESLP